MVEKIHLAAQRQPTASQPARAARRLLASSKAKSAFRATRGWMLEKTN